MSNFNNDSYVNNQVKKQYHETKISKYKIQLTEQPYPLDEETLDILLLDQDIEQIQRLVSDGVITYETIMQYYWNRILKYKDLNAVIELNPNCVSEARACQYDQSHHMVYGLPVLIKGNIGTKTMHTNAGAAIAKDFVCDEDAKIIKDLKAKGAIIIGKTNLSEWANFMSTESSNGYSALGGQTKNPYGHFDVGGSSAGSGVAAAMALAPLTIGTETAGSIIYPSSQNSVVGLKPTFGLISQDRIIPISESHDTAGPMTAKVKDCFWLFQAMTDQPHDLKDGLKGLNVGIVKNEAVCQFYRDHDEKVLDKVHDQLTAVARVSYFELEDKAFETQVYDVLKYEFREGVPKFFKTYGGMTLKVEDILAFNEKDMEACAPYNHEIIKQAAVEDFDPEFIHQQVSDNRRMTQEALDQAFETYDVLVTLSNYLTSVYAPAGYPAITVPAGYRSTGEPIGVTFIGRNGEDFKLLDIAYGFEQLTAYRIRPEVTV